MALLMVVAVGTIQLWLLLYARNTIHASAHEAARAAVERGTTGDEARSAAILMVRRSIGGMADVVTVDVSGRRLVNRRVVTVQVDARVAPTGPLPISVSVRASARVAAAAPPL